MGFALSRRFLECPYAPLLTHLSLVALVGSMFALLVYLPLWVALVPCAFLHHRIGILLHEYVHGIPFRRYKHNLWLLSGFDGLLLSFGMLEIFRGTHLAHHRWLNTERDPAVQVARSKATTGSILPILSVLEGPVHLKYLFHALRGRHPSVISRRIVVGTILSLVWIVFWILTGFPWMVLGLSALNLITSLASSLRGAIEHYSRPGDASFANEYKVWIPLFNLNRHIDHHLNPRRPWYLLRFRAEKPLPPICYWTHWYHAYIRRDYDLMSPPKEAP